MVVALLLLMDKVSPSLHLALEDEGIERGVFVPEALFDYVLHRWMLKDSLIRGLWGLLIPPHDLRSHALFRDLSPHRLEVVEKEPQNRIEVVQEGYHLRAIVARVAEVSPHDVTIPLLNVHVVVLLPRLGAREHDVLCITPVLGMPVHELAASIRVEHAEREREASVEVTQTVHRRALPFIPLSPQAQPIDGRVRHAHRIAKIAQEGIPTVGDRIDLRMPGRQSPPGTLEDRDDGFQCGGACGCGATSHAHAHECPHAALHGSFRHGEEFPGRVFPMTSHPIPSEDGDIFGNLRMQELSAGLIPDVPHVPQRRRHLRRIDEMSSTSLLVGRVSELNAPERP